jgi:ABC-type protease/lipase transport system fused ATPase/permease subunit
MNNRARRYGNLFLTVFLISLFIFQLKAVGQGVLSDNMDTAEFAQVRINKLQQAAKVLRELAMEPLPETLTDAEKTEAMKYTRWLRESSQKLNELARRWQDTRSNIGMIQSSVTSHEKMKEMNISFNRKYSALRDELLDELRQYATISPSMKSNYDIAQSSINTLR